MWKVTSYAYRIVKQNNATGSLLKAGNVHSSYIDKPALYFPN
jgi:hypothetical protein